MASPFIRGPYNYDMHAASLESALICNDPTRTRQEFKEECDINTIVERFGITGTMPESLVTPMSGDFTEVVDYRTSLHLLMEAEQAFLQVPAAIRERFGNDPHRFVEFVSDEKNRPALTEMGLLEVKRPAEPLLVRLADADLARMRGVNPTPLNPPPEAPEAA